MEKLVVAYKLCSSYTLLISDIKSFVYTLIRSNGMLGVIVDTEYKGQLALATNLAKDRQFDQAIVILKSLVSENSKDEIVLGLLASIYFQIGMEEHAKDFYLKILTVNPENALAAFQLGLAQLSTGQAQEAVDTWAPLLKNEQEFMAHFHTGLAFLELERPVEALNVLQIARLNMPKSHPLFEKADEIIASLENDNDE